MTALKPIVTPLEQRNNEVPTVTTASIREHVKVQWINIRKGSCLPRCFFRVCEIAEDVLVPASASGSIPSF